MANAYTNFNATVVAADVLVGLEKTLVYGSAFNRKYEGTISGKGSTVKIPNLGDPSISTYDPNTTVISPEVVADTVSTLLVDQAKYFAFKVDDVDQAFGAGGVLEVLAQRAGYKMGDTIDQFLASKLDAAVASGAANCIGTTASPKAWNSTSAVKTDILKVRELLNKQNVSPVGRFIVLPPEAITYLLGDTQLVSTTAPGQDALYNGSIGRFAGLDILESNNVPFAASKHSVIAGTAEASTLAVAVNSVKRYEPESGFSDAVKGLSVYGASVTRPTGLVKVIATIS